MSIRNLRFPLEMHVVYFKAKYAYYEEAAKHDDGVVFEVHFFYIQPDDNIHLNKIVTKLSSVCECGTSAGVDAMSLDTLFLPFKSDYLLYAGRIIAKKGGHKVMWLICRRPSGVSHKQMIGFRTLHSKDGRSLLRNFHYLHDLGNRRIYHVNTSDYLIGAVYPYPRPFSRESNKFRIQFWNVPSLLSSERGKFQNKKVSSKNKCSYTESGTFIDIIENNISVSQESFLLEKINSNPSESKASISNQDCSKSSLISVSSSFSNYSKESTVDREHRHELKTGGFNKINQKVEDKEVQVCNPNFDNIREVISVLVEEQTKKLIEEFKTNQVIINSQDQNSSNKATSDSIMRDKKYLETKLESEVKYEVTQNNEKDTLNLEWNTITSNSKKSEQVKEFPPASTYRGLKNLQSRMLRTKTTSDKRTEQNGMARCKAEAHNVGQCQPNLSSQISYVHRRLVPQRRGEIGNTPFSTKRSDNACLNDSGSGKTTNNSCSYKLKKSKSDIKKFNVYNENGCVEYKILKDGDTAKMSVRKKHNSSSPAMDRFQCRSVRDVLCENEEINSTNKLKGPKKLDKSKDNSKVKTTKSKGSFNIIVKKQPTFVHPEENSTKQEGILSSILLVAKDVLTSPIAMVSQSISKISSDFGKKNTTKPFRKPETRNNPDKSATVMKKEVNKITQRGKFQSSRPESFLKTNEGKTEKTRIKSNLKKGQNELANKTVHVKWRKQINKTKI